MSSSCLMYLMAQQGTGASMVKHSLFCNYFQCRSILLEIRASKTSKAYWAYHQVHRGHHRVQVGPHKWDHVTALLIVLSRHPTSIHLCPNPLHRRRHHSQPCDLRHSRRIPVAACSWCPLVYRTWTPSCAIKGRLVKG